MSRLRALLRDLLYATGFAAASLIAAALFAACVYAWFFDPEARSDGLM